MDKPPCIQRIFSPIKAVIGKTPKEKPYVDENGKFVKEYLWQEQKQMGMVSNLITDMTLMGAPIDHLVRATKHSMTVIDVKKHHLDWRRSEISRLRS